MLTIATISNMKKVSWLIYKNESNVLREVKKIPKQGFSDSMFDKWLHKATFWF
jgi:hypothetical protein